VRELQGCYSGSGLIPICPNGSAKTSRPVHGVRVFRVFEVTDRATEAPADFAAGRIPLRNMKLAVPLSERRIPLLVWAGRRLFWSV
jgi:hypothetical protein